ncbi:low-density lipoprotein receptor-related protein 6 [Asbolus verrucosus]|uniref:Low-density lipoprotein receptor-related protein 6 n=1 Tax=Asbolus verrucosus TaxID=1661398 RepID=A0A482VQY2_ASBVE|nr:low-density lipoprotein receptor-related protein 6 [Asbolus verrucosus]
MILQPTTVELTKIQYYDSKNAEPLVIPTISREIFDNHVNSNVIIKKNIFGHRWVLKINEIGGGGDKFHWRLIVYVLVFSCIIIAVAFGLYLTFDKSSLHLSNRLNETGISHQNAPAVVPTPTPTTHEKITTKLCQNCKPRDICLKLSETDTPKCMEPLDKKDPTGCGGFCYVNTQFCQLLDNLHQIYQCSNLKNTLKCPSNAFNCGNMCINKSKRCDGIVHCSNKSDEMNCDCDLETNFRCGNMTSCLSKEKKCDGIVDCWDKSDELDCKKGCKNGTVPCLSGDCIPKENFCDGEYHCPDQSDEPQGCQF